MQEAEQVVAEDDTMAILVQGVLAKAEDLHCCNYTYLTKAKDF